MGWANYLIKDPEEPGRASCEGRCAAKGIPDGQGTPNKLIPTRRVHGIYAHVATANAHGALWRKCACWVVLGDN